MKALEIIQYFLMKRQIFYLLIRNNQGEFLTGPGDDGSCQKMVEIHVRHNGTNPDNSPVTIPLEQVFFSGISIIGLR